MYSKNLDWEGPLIELWYYVIKKLCLIMIHIPFCGPCLLWDVWRCWLVLGIFKVKMKVNYHTLKWLHLKCLFYSIFNKCVMSSYRDVLRCHVSHQERAAFILPQTGWDDLWKATERAWGQNSGGVRWDIDDKAGRFVSFVCLKWAWRQCIARTP